jgi:hypothetical protein
MANQRNQAIFFGIDDSTKENKNNVEVPVGKQIDDDDPFFAEADDHNEGEKITTTTTTMAMHKMTMTAKKGR